MKIGDNIRNIRLEQGFSQSKFSEKLGISRTYLSDLENNRKSPSIETVSKIAEKLDVSTLYLLYGKKTSKDIETMDKGKVIEMHEWFEGTENDAFETVYQNSINLINHPENFDKNSIESIANLYKLLATLNRIENDNKSLTFQTKNFLTVLMQNLNYQIDTDPTISLNDFYNKVINETEYPK
ncbi:helix-turn-helix domain-containing protein [Enterococcus dispar]|uniref:helix-turn-helix domain-containing protein n=1 Tax=Enterococcus dispar TaxID=44009 RepID=UPI00288F77B9|nr:helix-turn-helix transcriptional regulator [Enterococcus dispar]MDT2705558.1 helix-turn-helix transcriptional regulator [Enterococcus dispar]